MITSFNEYINETYINLLEDNDMLKYSDEVWNILQISYASIGGFKTATTPQNLIDKSFLWKLVRKNGKIVTAIIYKKSFGGRKLIGGGTDGSDIGKENLFKILHDDINLVERKMWTEVSGALEKKCLEFGGILISNEYAKFLTNKDILTYDSDGYHYTRLIGGIETRKVIIGNISNDILANLK